MNPPENILSRTSPAGPRNAARPSARPGARCFLPPSLCLLFAAFTAAAETTNSVPLSSPPLPEMGVSLLKVLGALAVVLSIFLGGVWFFRNWQRLVIQRGRAPRLNVLEVRSLGGRHALYVVGYEQERFLLGTSPAGINLLSHLQPAEVEAPTDSDASPQPSFARTLTQMLKGK